MILSNMSRIGLMFAVAGTVAACGSPSDTAVQPQREVQASTVVVPPSESDARWKVRSVLTDGQRELGRVEWDDTHVSYAFDDTGASGVIPAAKRPPFGATLDGATAPRLSADELNAASAFAVDLYDAQASPVEAPEGLGQASQALKGSPPWYCGIHWGCGACKCNLCDVIDCRNAK